MNYPPGSHPGKEIVRSNSIKKAQLWGKINFAINCMYDRTFFRDITDLRSFFKRSEFYADGRFFM
jgi:hypothetical protein